ncbi:MAG: HEAT repeat domain-containing protein [Acidobacteria bacterium]|nr:HEAT repeat domain-containing protein [Acidobacteriota bacterium]
MNLHDSFQTRIARLIVGSMMVLGLAAGVALAQEPSKQAALLTRLASGNEDQRADVVIELGSMLSAYPAEQTTVDALSQTLRRDSSPLVRALAARAMELSRDERFVTTLLASLKTEKDISIRKASIYALAYQRSSQVVGQVVGILLPLMKDKKQDIRAAATFALAEIGDPIARDSLIDLLEKRGKDEDIFARSQAARGLGKMADPESIEALIVALNRDKAQDVRRASAQALGLIAGKQDAKAVEALESAKHDVDPYLVSAAETALSRINSRNP